MTSGTIGIIGCPILDDEIIHTLLNDHEEKRIYLVGTQDSHALQDKLTSNGIQFEIIDEWEFNNGHYNINRADGFNIVVIMNEIGLHKRPEILRSTIEEQIRFYRGRFDVIALYYGMCGNAGWDAHKWASEVLDYPVFVFRDEHGDVCDDCIGVAVGGHSRYCDFVKRYPGMFYVTPSIASNWDEYSKKLDFCKGFEIMNIHTVREVFGVFGYKNAVKIDTGLGIRGEKFDTACRHFSEDTGLDIITIEPDVVDIYPAEKIYSDAKGMLRP